MIPRYDPSQQASDIFHSHSPVWYVSWNSPVTTLPNICLHLCALRYHNAKKSMHLHNTDKSHLSRHQHTPYYRILLRSVVSVCVCVCNVYYPFVFELVSKCINILCYCVLLKSVCMLVVCEYNCMLVDD
jgi:hypothetical protein